MVLSIGQEIIAKDIVGVSVQPVYNSRSITAQNYGLTAHKVMHARQKAARNQSTYLSENTSVSLRVLKGWKLLSVVGVSSARSASVRQGALSIKMLEYLLGAFVEVARRCSQLTLRCSMLLCCLTLQETSCCTNLVPELSNMRRGAGPTPWVFLKVKRNQGKGRSLS